MNAPAPLENPPAEIPAYASPASCTHCQAEFRDNYFQANGTPFCGTCIEALRNSLSGPGSSAGRFLRAILLGGGAALVSAIAYGLFMGLTNIEFALVTIAIGWFIGKAVRNGSGNRGGWRYGVLAVVLTYCAIAFSYFGVAVTHEIKNHGKPASETGSTTKAAKSAKEEESATVAEAKPAAAAAESEADPAKEMPGNPLIALGLLVVTAFAMPILVATQSILSALITGFGLWEAWKINRGFPAPDITGPHPVTAAV